MKSKRSRPVRGKVSQGPGQLQSLRISSDCLDLGLWGVSERSIGVEENGEGSVTAEDFMDEDVDLGEEFSGDVGGV
jgi:hypothetical protein